MSGSGITSPATVDAQLLGGITHEDRIRIRFLTGVGLAGPDTYSVNAEGKLTDSLGSFEVTASGNSWLSPLPPVLSGSNLNSVVSDEEAVFQRRHLINSMLKDQMTKSIAGDSLCFFGSSPLFFLCFGYRYSGTVVGRKQRAYRQVAWSASTKAVS
jgi:hypothetical protein